MWLWLCWRGMIFSVVFLLVVCLVGRGRDLLLWECWFVSWGCCCLMRVFWFWMLFLKWCCRRGWIKLCGGWLCWLLCIGCILWRRWMWFLWWRGVRWWIRGCMRSWWDGGRGIELMLCSRCCSSFEGGRYI